MWSYYACSDWPWKHLFHIFIYMDKLSHRALSRVCIASAKHEAGFGESETVNPYSITFPNYFSRIRAKTSQQCLHTLI